MEQGMRARVVSADQWLAAGEETTAAALTETHVVIAVAAQTHASLTLVSFADESSRGGGGGTQSNSASAKSGTDANSNAIATRIPVPAVINHAAVKGALLLLASDDALFAYSLLDLSKPVQTIPLKERITALAVEDALEESVPVAAVLGLVGGAVVQSMVGRYSWVSRQTQTLHRGHGRAVCALHLKHDCLLWSDSVCAYMLNVMLRSLLVTLPLDECLVPSLSLKAHFAWRDGDQGGRSVFAVWGSSVTALRQRPGQPVQYFAAAHQHLDCVALFASHFDSEHICVLGHPLTSQRRSSLSAAPPDLLHGARVAADLTTLHLKLVHCESCAVLHLQSVDVSGLGLLARGGLLVVSSYAVPSRKHDYLRWTLNAPRRPRGGYRGLPPLLLVVATGGIMALNVKDADDLVEEHIASKHFKAAFDVALQDSTALHRLSLSEVVDLYVQELLNSLTATAPDSSEPVASERRASGSAEEVRGVSAEMSRALRQDSKLWTKWSLHCLDRKVGIDYSIVPIHNPRLEGEVYEGILQFLFDRDPFGLLQLVRIWSKIDPPLFDRVAFIARLEESAREAHSSEETKEDESSTQSAVAKYLHLETLSILYLSERQPERALECLLDIESFAQENYLALGTSFVRLQLDVRERDVRRIFDLIRDQNLFNAVTNKIPALVRLSRELSQSFLVAHIQHFPIATVVAQLDGDSAQLLDYLNSLLRLLPDVYNEQQYARVHDVHLSLFAAQCQSSSFSMPEFLLFLQYSKHVAFQKVLDLCLSIVPLPIEAVVFSLTKLERYTEALAMLLEKGAKASEVLHFVENHGVELWKIVVHFSLSNPAFLSDLLSHVVDHGDRAVELISEIPVDMVVPELQDRISNMLVRYNRDVEMNSRVLGCIREEADVDLRQLIEARKRGVVVYRDRRCDCCDLLLSNRPLFDSDFLSASYDLEFGLVISRQKCFHRYCYEKHVLHTEQLP